MPQTQMMSQAAAFHGVGSGTKIESWTSDGDEDLPDPDSAFKPHPLGVKPSGNALAAKPTALCETGVFGGLPDEIILVLLEWLDSRSLLNLGASCRGLYAYTTFDQIWKDLFILYAESLFTLFSPLTPFLS